MGRVFLTLLVTVERLIEAAQVGNNVMSNCITFSIGGCIPDLPTRCEHTRGATVLPATPPPLPFSLRDSSDYIAYITTFPLTVGGVGGNANY